MGSTNGVQPSCKLATMTMQMMPSSSCIHRPLRTLAAGAATTVDAVTIVTSNYPNLCMSDPIASVNLAILFLWLLVRDEESIGLHPMTSVPEFLAQFGHCCCCCEQIL